MKKCTVCKIEKEENEFYKRKNRPCGFTSHCKRCELDKKKKYYSENIDKMREKNTKYHNENKEKLSLYGKNKWKNDENYRNRVAEYRKKQAQIPEVREKNRIRGLKNNRKYRQNPLFRLISNLRNRIYKMVKKECKSAHSKELIGCDWKFLKQYIQERFRPGMTWENYGHKTWHIDHIIPVDSFDLLKEEEQRKCFHYTNLQPLWATTDVARANGDMESIGNLNKNAKII